MRALGLQPALGSPTTKPPVCQPWLRYGSPSQGEAKPGCGTHRTP